MKIVTIILLTLMKTCLSFESYCNNQKECITEKEKIGHLTANYQTLKCLLTDMSRLRFNKSFEKIASGKKCEKIDLNGISKLLLRPKKEGSIILEQGMIDLDDLIGFEIMLNFTITEFEIKIFKGYELNLYDDLDNYKELILSYFKPMGIMDFTYSIFDFYLKDKRLTTCKEFIEAANQTNPRSIFQIVSKLSNYLYLFLAENRNKLCPLAFKDIFMRKINIYGENSFYSQRILSFSNDTIKDLNSKIINLLVDISNVELNMDFLHPDVFKELITLRIISKVKKIHPDIFIWLNKVYIIWLKNDFVRSLMHNSGIEWIRNINKDVNLNLENVSEVSNYISRKKYIFLECFKNPNSLPIIDVFPDKDFCLYKDFPVNQLVIIMEDCSYRYESGILHDKITCTYLWMTRSYKYLVEFYEANNLLEYLLNSSDYKSIANCNFEKKLELCNKSSFVAKSFITYFEMSEALKMAESVINILSYILSIFGIITNLLIIITISHKKNKEEFKGYKHYSYLRLNSICSVLILLIHLISWLNQCIYPFQVFCPIIRKTVFMQYFKIIIEEVLMTSLKFMNNFTYIAFAFNRISLIGKDHNKLVKFMSDLGIKTYIGVTLFISIGLSVIKFFEYDINSGQPFESYPISYEYFNILKDRNYLYTNLTVYILNLISDSFNYFIFLIVNFAIDIGMIVKLRQTLNEKLEKSKEYSTKDQLEKKKIENEAALNKTRSMIIWNITLNLILKLPATLYSILNLCIIIFKSNLENYHNHPGFTRFIMRTFVDGYLYSFLFKFSGFLYLFYISIQLFFYKHYDKKFSQSYKNIFRTKKSN